MKGNIIISGVFGLLILAVSIYNMITNQDYFEMSFFQTLTLSATVFLAFYMSQKLTFDRKRKEMAEGLICIIQEELTDRRFKDIQSQEDIDYVGIKIRRVANKIDNLKILGEKIKIVDEVKYISDKFSQYENLFGNHTTELEYLSKSKVDFENIIVCIDDKCAEIITKFYK